MKVFHTFDNYADQDINVRTEGAIESVVTESKTPKMVFSQPISLPNITLLHSTEIFETYQLNREM